ncbi:hypothetical protein [Methylorubrum populi]|uniref:hypothetical protein n=1 Tax=Methylorubrum populi TaxID=223967 RepID=UPI003F655397
MNMSMPEHEWKSGAIDFDRLPRTAAGLSALINIGSDVPIQRNVRTGTFPSFKAARFALTHDYGYIINVWRVRNGIEKYHVIGGVEVNVDKSAGYIAAYQRLLDNVLANEESSQRVLQILDHIITNSILNG